MSAQGLMFNRIQHWPKQLDLNLWSLIFKVKEEGRSLQKFFKLSTG